jgi:hypothetical protein
LFSLGLDPGTVVPMGWPRVPRICHGALPRSSPPIGRSTGRIRGSAAPAAERHPAEYVIARWRSGGEHPCQCPFSISRAGRSSRRRRPARRWYVADGVYGHGDGLVSGRGLPGSFVLKADVQGAELKALEGASRTLENTEPVLQISLFRSSRGPELHDVVF